MVSSRLISVRRSGERKSALFFMYHAIGMHLLPTILGDLIDNSIIKFLGHDMEELVLFTGVVMP